MPDTILRVRVFSYLRSRIWKEDHGEVRQVAAVAELVERFRAADAVLLTEYRGLTVGQLK